MLRGKDFLVRLWVELLILSGTIKKAYAFLPEVRQRGLLMSFVTGTYNPRG